MKAEHNESKVTERSAERRCDPPLEQQSRQLCTSGCEVIKKSALENSSLWFCLESVDVKQTFHSFALSTSSSNACIFFCSCALWAGRARRARPLPVLAAMNHASDRRGTPGNDPSSSGFCRAAPGAHTEAITSRMTCVSCGASFPQIDLLPISFRKWAVRSTRAERSQFTQAALLAPKHYDV